MAGRRRQARLGHRRIAGLTSRFDCDKPIIAAVNGVAMGGGFEIALACDLIIASENARFALPEPHVGLAALAGGLHRLPRQIGLKRAMGMILTARHVTAKEGHELGFVNEVVPAGEALIAAERWAETICKNSPMSIRASKQAIQKGLAVSLEQAMAEQREYPAVKAMAASQDYIEGPKAFSEKRPPKWVGRRRSVVAMKQALPVIRGSDEVASPGSIQPNYAITRAAQEAVIPMCTCTSWNG